MADTEQKNQVQEVELDGYKFMVDTDLLDDVETLELIDRIESRNQVGAIIPMLVKIIGVEEYEKLKADQIKKDGELHKDMAGYKPRFRMGKLQEVYVAIIDKFNPKV